MKHDSTYIQNPSAQPALQRTAWGFVTAAFWLLYLYLLMPLVTLLIITMGVGLIIKGAVQLAFGKGTYSLPAFSGDAPILIGKAALAPQSLWVMGCTTAVVLLLAWYFARTLGG